MRTVLLATALLAFLGGTTGCDNSTPSKPPANGENGSPPPVDSGANKTKLVRPAPPPKQ
ncbi:MAG: hypothetical protein ACKODX_14915 [Gemmata sp.]